MASSMNRLGLCEWSESLPVEYDDRTGTYSWNYSNSSDEKNLIDVNDVEDVSSILTSISDSDSASACPGALWMARLV